MVVPPTAAGQSSSTAGAVFVAVLNPPPRLIIVGAVHIAQALAPMAALAGYARHRHRPAPGLRHRGALSRASTLDGDWPDEAMERLEPDRRTAVVTLTHDPKLDDPALSAALRSPAFYIGALGSRKTHAARAEPPRRAPASATSDLARIHGPVGLDIGAMSPAEIAVSILAQITGVCARGRQSQAAGRP